MVRSFWLSWVNFRHWSSYYKCIHCIWQVTSILHSILSFSVISGRKGRNDENKMTFVRLNFRYNVIANPLEGKLSMTKAIFMVVLIWCYTLPWCLFPYFKVWGRYVPGDLLNSILIFDKIKCITHTIVGCFVIYRGFLNNMQLWLLDRNIRQQILCCCPLHIFLCNPNVADYFLLQSNCQTCF